jgi:hypothetical protein
MMLLDTIRYTLDIAYQYPENYNTQQSSGPGYHNFHCIFSFLKSFRELIKYACSRLVWQAFTNIKHICDAKSKLHYTLTSTFGCLCMKMGIYQAYSYTKEIL